MNLMMELLVQFLQNSESHAQDALKLLVDLAGRFASTTSLTPQEMDASYLKKSAPQLVPFMMSLIKEQNFGQDTRCLGLEFIVTFVENKPTFLAKADGFTKVQTIESNISHVLSDSP